MNFRGRGGYCPAIVAWFPFFKPLFRFSHPCLPSSSAIVPFFFYLSLSLLPPSSPLSLPPSLTFVANASFSFPFFTLDHLLICLVAIITVSNFCATSLTISLWNIHVVRRNHRLLVNVISPVSPLAQSPISSLVRTRSL